MLKISSVFQEILDSDDFDAFCQSNLTDGVVCNCVIFKELEGNYRNCNDVYDIIKANIFQEVEEC